MRPSAGKLAIVLAASAGLSCVSMWEGDRMRADTKKLRERVGELEKRDAENEQKLAQLRKLLDDATSLLARNSADVGARVQSQEAQLAQVTGQIEEAKHLLESLQKRAAEEQARLQAVEQTQAKIASKVAPTMAEDKDQLWKQANDLLLQGNREEGRRFLRGYLQRFPQDPRAPQAVLQIGLAFAAEGRHTQAAAEYQKILESYNKSPEVPEAMWLLGQAFLDLKFCSDAKAVLLDLSRRYPKSPRAADLKTRLRDIAKIAKDRDRCSS
jgi:TolA-binding protein